jgi:hypothetical protein
LSRATNARKNDRGFNPGGHGGAKGEGAAFKATPPTKTIPYWRVTGMHSFDDSDSYPIAALMLGADGNFYGTTFNGGGSPRCLSTGGCDTVFRLSVGLAPSGK